MNTLIGLSMLLAYVAIAAPSHRRASATFNERLLAQGLLGSHSGPIDLPAPTTTWSLVVEPLD